VEYLQPTPVVEVVVLTMLQVDLVDLVVPVVVVQDLVILEYQELMLLVVLALVVAEEVDGLLEDMVVMVVQVS